MNASIHHLDPARSQAAARPDNVPLSLQQALAWLPRRALIGHTVAAVLALAICAAGDTLLNFLAFGQSVGIDPVTGLPTGDHHLTIAGFATATLGLFVVVGALHAARKTRAACAVYAALYVLLGFGLLPLAADLIGASAALFGSGGMGEASVIPLWGWPLIALGVSAYTIPGLLLCAAEWQLMQSWRNWQLRGEALRLQENCRAAQATIDARAAQDARAQSEDETEQLAQAKKAARDAVNAYGVTVDADCQRLAAASQDVRLSGEQRAASLSLLAQRRAVLKSLEVCHD